MQCYLYEDKLKVSSGEDTRRYADLLELLTPVAKTYGAEMGLVSVNNGLQVLGGYGYTEDFMLEQLLRDVRIMSIYEGTTGIQSQALLGRQVPAGHGRSFRLLKEEITRVINTSRSIEELGEYAEWLNQELAELEDTTQHLLKHRSSEEIFLSDATLYMELFGHVCVGWQWLLQAVVAHGFLKRDISADEKRFYLSKVETMRFFFHYELRKTKGLHQRLRDNTVITVRTDEEILV
jgi:butyryl-CoA dehydrogenase